jgi:RNA polymerase sigma factor (sigma-70 family)
MPTSPVSLIEHFCRAVPSDGDGELLGRFVERRDETALAALVKRHGPMVWGVCRRLLAHHDAEDAFQATFIVLVRKAASVKPRGMVGNWLYGVARQVSLQARTTVRRRAREIQVTQMPDVEAPQDKWADVRPILDEELSRLPDHYRAVIVLCDLESRSRKEVARQFGCPEGTVASRLARAREMLAKRLTARGVALSGGVAVLAQGMASASVPASVVSSTIKAASLCAAGQAVMPVKVAALAEGVMKAMLVSKLKPAMAVLIVAAMVGLIGYGVAMGQQKGDPVAPQNQPSEKKVEDAKAADAVVKDKAEQKEAIAWGKEVDGLQAGLVADAGTCRQGEKLNLTVKLRNVGKAEVTVSYRLLEECAPQVTNGGKVSVFMPAPKDYLAVPIKRTLKPGETITLYNPEVAVESEDRAKVLGEMRVERPTICVAPGKYKIAFAGMIQSHPKLSTGTVEFEVKDQVAWGKEVGGLQAGLGFKPGDKRVYHHGETATLALRVRNVSKEDVKFQYLEEFFMEKPPTVTGGEGKGVRLGGVDLFGPLVHIPVDVNLAPGKEMELHDLKLKLEPASGDVTEVSPEALRGKGKFQIQYEQVFGNSSAGGIEVDPTLSKLATGKLELEVKEAEKLPEKEDNKEAVTVWGKEVGGLQAGLGFRPGEKRAYSHGETVTLVVRVRNVGKEEVTFQYVPAFFQETLPTVTHGTGEPVLPIRGVNAPGKTHPATAVTIAPGKEVELFEWNARLAHDPLAGGADDRGVIYVRTGKFSVQYERVLGNSSASRIKIDPALSKLATGKLELEVTEKK